MPKKSNYQVKQFDMSKGMRAETGHTYDQGMIPRLLRNLYYDKGGSLVTRRSVTAYAGVYDALRDGSTRDGALLSGATVANLTTDGRRVYGVTSFQLTKSDMTDAGLVDDSFVCELVNPNGTPYWNATRIPAPRAVVPIASTGAMATTSLGDDGASGFILTGAASSTSTAEANIIDGSSARQSPVASYMNASIGLYNFVQTRAIGGGFFIGIDEFAIVTLCKVDGRGLRYWRLRDALEVEIEIDEEWDALYISGSIYLVYKFGTDTIVVQRYAEPVTATGSNTATPTNIEPDAEINIDMAASFAWGGGVGRYADRIAISSKASPTELRFAVAGRNAAGTSGYVTYVRRNLSTLAAVGIQDSSSDSSYPYCRAVTCNGNIIIAERSESADEFSINTASYTYDIVTARTAGLYAYTYNTSTTLTATSLFPFSAADNAGVSDQELFTADFRMYTHISSGGLLCVGGNIYRVGEENATSPGVKNLTARFICKAVDLWPTLLYAGEASVSGVSEPARKRNSMSRWISERYVAIPSGSTERAVPLKDPDATATTLTGMTSNDRVVLFDVQSTKLSCIEERSSVSCFGHGWSLGADGAAMSTLAVDAPVLTVAFDTSPKVRAGRDWAAEVISYRAVLVHSVGGVESYLSSTTKSLTAVSPTNIEMDIEISVLVNYRNPNGAKIRIYRNRSSVDAAGDFHFLTELDCPTTTGTVTARDPRLSNESATRTFATSRPLDPTAGGVTLQGRFLAGMRDIASTATRNYVVTHDAVYPCQELIGDDRLPTPMPDIAVPIPPQYGAGKFVSSVSDSIVLSTDSAILSVSGEPANMSGQGGNQAAFVIVDGAGAIAKPCSTPVGVFIPRADGISVVDASRSAAEAARSIMGAAPNGLLGDCSYLSSLGLLIVAGGTSTVPDSSGETMFVLDAADKRWTSWAGEIPVNTGVACPIRGAFAGGVYFGITVDDSGYIPASGATYDDAVVDTGWNSYDGRFIETALRRVMMDGYAADDEVVDVSMDSQYNLRPTAGTPQTVSAASFSVYRDGAGLRWTITPARSKGSSFRHVITLAPENNVQIELNTLAVEMQSDVNKYTAANRTA